MMKFHPIIFKEPILLLWSLFDSELEADPQKLQQSVGTSQLHTAASRPFCGCRDEGRVGNQGLEPDSASGLGLGTGSRGAEAGARVRAGGWAEAEAEAVAEAWVWESASASGREGV